MKTLTAKEWKKIILRDAKGQQIPPWKMARQIETNAQESFDRGQLTEAGFKSIKKWAGEIFFSKKTYF